VIVSFSAPAASSIEVRIDDEGPGIPLREQ
jgi:signal transduction histidine kinase